MAESYLKQKEVSYYI